MNLKKILLVIAASVPLTAELGKVDGESARLIENNITGFGKLRWGMRISEVRNIINIEPPRWDDWYCRLAYTAVPRPIRVFNTTCQSVVLYFYIDDKQKRSALAAVKFILPANSYESICAKLSEIYGETIQNNYEEVQLHYIQRQWKAWNAPLTRIMVMRESFCHGYWDTTILTYECRQLIDYVVALTPVIRTNADGDQETNHGTIYD